MLEWIAHLLNVEPAKAQKFFAEKEAVLRILIGPGVTVLAPLSAAYMIYRGLMQPPFLLPGWVAMCCGATIEMTAFHIGGELLEVIDSNRRLRARDRSRKGGRAILLSFLFVSFVVGEMMFIGFMETWWGFFLPLLSVVNTLTTNERISRFWREQEVKNMEQPAPVTPVHSLPPVSDHRMMLPVSNPPFTGMAGGQRREREQEREREREREQQRQALLEAREKNPTASYAELGRLTAEALGRDRPFAKSWVAKTLKGT